MLLTNYSLFYWFFQLFSCLPFPIHCLLIFSSLLNFWLYSAGWGKSGFQCYLELKWLRQLEIRQNESRIEIQRLPHYLKTRRKNHISHYKIKLSGRSPAASHIVRTWLPFRPIQPIPSRPLGLVVANGGYKICFYERQSAAHCLRVRGHGLSRWWAGKLAQDILARCRLRLSCLWLTVRHYNDFNGFYGRDSAPIWARWDRWH